jgi:hypothetical protein
MHLTVKLDAWEIPLKQMVLFNIEKRNEICQGKDKNFFSEERATLEILHRIPIPFKSRIQGSNFKGKSKLKRLWPLFVGKL